MAFRLSLLHQALSLDSKLLSDDSAKSVFDFRMSRNRRLATIRRVYIQVMPPTVAVKLTPCLSQLFEKGSAFHTSTSIGLLCACGGSGSKSASLRKSA